MKKSISILFCLFMFPLFLNTSQVNAQSSVPSCLSFKSGDHAARIECFKKNEKEFRARIKELRTKHNIEQVNYDSFGESCPSQAPGDHAARLECFKNNDNAYQAIINELMATKEGSAVDFNNEAKRFQESTTEGQHIQQLEAKISDLEGKLTNAVSPTVYDDAVRLYKEQQAQFTEANTKISDLEGKLLKADAVFDDVVRLNKEQKAQIEVQQQGINELSSLLEASRAKHLALEESYNQLETKFARITATNTEIGSTIIEQLRAQQVKLDEQTNQLETNRKEAEEQQNRINTISGKYSSCTSQIDICTAAKEKRGVEFSDYLTEQKTKQKDRNDEITNHVRRAQATYDNRVTDFCELEHKDAERRKSCIYQHATAGNCRKSAHYENGVRTPNEHCDPADTSAIRATFDAIYILLGSK